MRALFNSRSLVLTGLVTALLAAPALAAPNLRPMQEGNVTYLSGGIGQTEANALKAEAHDYDLRITNSDNSGHYIADTDMTITSQDGRQMITASSTGPLFYAQLPPGTYTVEANSGDKHWQRTVKIGANKPADLHIVWGGGQS